MKDLVYKCLCKCPFDLLYNFNFLQNHRKAGSLISNGKVVTTYFAGSSSNASPGFRVLIKTVAGQKYSLNVKARLVTGDSAFVYIESVTGARLVPRTYTFSSGATQEYRIEFTAIDDQTWVGILFSEIDLDYVLDTYEFLVSCVKKDCCPICPTGPIGLTGPTGPIGPSGPTDCQLVLDCLCDVPVCDDEFMYEICIDFTQILLDMINYTFPSGTMIYILGYVLGDGSSISGSQPIGIVPVTFDEIGDAFTANSWTVTGLPGEFRATLNNQTDLITQVVIGKLGDTIGCPMIPPFPICFPTNCSQITYCATNDCENKLLIMKPGASGSCELCWAHICPPETVTCLAKCGTEDHVAILPAESLSNNCSLSVGPRGSGFLSAQKPDGTPVGGDCRGTSAVDLQMSRLVSTQVASGDYSVIGGGNTNICTDLYGVVSGGFNNRVLAAESCISGGSNNFINTDGNNSTILGGSTNQCNSRYSVASGSGSLTRLYAQQAWSAGLLANRGDRQCSKYMLKWIRTRGPDMSDNTYYELVLFDGNRITLPRPATWFFNVRVLVGDGFANGTYSFVLINNAGVVTSSQYPGESFILDSLMAINNVGAMPVVGSDEAVLEVVVNSDTIDPTKMIACVDVVEINY